MIDPAADVALTNHSPALSGQIAAIPAGVLATSTDRLSVENIGRASDAARLEGGVAVPTGFAGVGSPAFATAGGGLLTAVRMQSLQAVEPLPVAIRDRALRQVDQELVAAGLLDKPGGDVSPEAKVRFSFERCSSIPTPGLLVRGCLDECDICEPELKKAIDLELEHKRLENEHLRRTIELMEKDQEHRCCPVEEEEPAPA